MPQCLHKSLKKEYEQVCNNLYAESLWHVDRLPLVIAYLAGAYALRELAASISRDGVIMKDGKRNPSMAAYNSLVPILVRSGSALGLTVVRSSPIVKDDPSVTDKTSGKWAQAAAVTLAFCSPCSTKLAGFPPKSKVWGLPRIF